MSGASTLDPDNLPDNGSIGRKGNDTGSLGPSDSSDTGSDVASGSVTGPEEMASDSDAAGTGDRAGVGRNDPPGADIGVDRAIDAADAGLGTGLDEAELARHDDGQEGGRGD
jgi:hypothetical protein